MASIHRRQRANINRTTILPLSFNWFIDEMLPALVLLILAVIGIFWTLTERNKEPENTSQETESGK
jgi:Na+/H+ antiporter NhaD/arsenite permease-like protein